MQLQKYHVAIIASFVKFMPLFCMKCGRMALRSGAGTLGRCWKKRQKCVRAGQVKCETAGRTVQQGSIRVFRSAGRQDRGGPQGVLQHVKKKEEKRSCAYCSLCFTASPGYRISLQACGAL